MAEIGRNEPCPCGSGKKYKKCCLANDQARAREREPNGALVLEPPSLGALTQRVGGSLTPYVFAKEVEESEAFASLQQTDPARAARLWTPSRVAALGTDEILARLRELGIEMSRERFVSLAADRTSAWTISEPWRATANTPWKALSREDDDFLGLAACELWKRYCPDRPSQEMLDDWMQAGYHLASDDEAAACERWMATWDVIRARLRPEMRTCDQATAVFHGTQSLFNWVQDLALALLNAAHDEPRFAGLGVRLCRQVLDQFPDEDEDFHLGLRGDLGELLFLAGQHAEGERAFRELIAEYPDRSVGYARLAEMLGLGIRPGDPPLDRAQALALLEQAVARPVDDAAIWDLETRLDDLRQITVDEPTDAT